MHAIADNIRLRDTIHDDVAIFFEHQLDPEVQQMVAFTPKEPSDSDAFMAHWAKIMADDSIIKRTILLDGQVVGQVAKFERHGTPEVTYWIEKEHWGKGICTRALSMLLQEVKGRPLYARTAKDNAGSRRVLEKCGFKLFREEKNFANAHGEEIDEVIMKLN